MSRMDVRHLGRAGEVPGGMTQVVNGYLGWQFEHADVSVITTRGDPRDLPAAAINAAKALVTVARLRRGNTVVVAHLSERGSFLREGTLLRLARLRGLGTVAHLHGASFAEFAHRFPAATRFALGAADRVISLSQESSDVAARFVPAGRIELVPNAIPPGSPVPGDQTVVFGGVVSHRKGVDVLLSAWEALGDATDGWRLIIAGPIREPEVVRQVPRSEFPGSLTHSALMRLLDRAQVAVLPSREEAMPMFILEAMARRTCVIATPVGGIAPVLDHGRGVLVGAGEVAGLTEALGKAIGDVAFRAARAAAAFEAFDTRYSARAVFPIVEGVWAAALTDAQTRRRPSAVAASS